MSKNRARSFKQFERQPSARELRQQRRESRRRGNVTSNEVEPRISYREADLAFEAKLELQANRIKFGKLEAQTPKQEDLIRMIEDTRLTFVKGPAGTGKTFISTSIAAELLMKEEIEQIIITRPMVGCDEDIGFMPGDELEKFMGWLGPFMDVLEGKMGKKKVESYLRYEKIIARPLMMMRGSTFRNSFIILDEAQNTTENQMKMFLTRLGKGSKVVVTGDVEQSDLVGRRNGLVDALEILQYSRNVGVFEFGEDDIVRDGLVRDIVKAYRRKYANRDPQVAALLKQAA